MIRDNLENFLNEIFNNNKKEENVIIRVSNLTIYDLINLIKENKATLNTDKSLTQKDIILNILELSEDKNRFKVYPIYSYIRYNKSKLSKEPLKLIIDDDIFQSVYLYLKEIYNLYYANLVDYPIITFMNISILRSLDEYDKKEIENILKTRVELIINVIEEE